MTGVRTAAVTGATGFIGTPLAAMLEGKGWTVQRLTRQMTGPLETAGNLESLLAGIDTVYHLAGRAHVTDMGANDEALFDAANHLATRNLADATAKAGCRRFIFISTIKVHGEATDHRPPFHPNDTPAPEDAYARSKLNAERALANVAARTGLKTAIVRPPLVFGPEARGNLARLSALMARGLPLPLAGIGNRRSMIGLDNLCSLLCHLGESAHLPDIPLLPHDITLSTPDLLRRMAAMNGQAARLFPVPVSVLRACLSAIGRGADAQRLIGSLEIAADALPKDFGWNASAEGNPLTAQAPKPSLS